jgi:hypothetical protein
MKAIITAEQVLMALLRAREEIEDDTEEVWDITEDEIIYEIVGTGVGYGAAEYNVIWQALTPLILTGQIEVESWVEYEGCRPEFAFRLKQPVS